MCSARNFDLHETLERIRHWLPQQGPIKDFVHHNTLHAFQHLKFHDAVRAAAHFYGARSYMPISFYREKFEAGQITESGLNRALVNLISEPDQRDEYKRKMLAGKYLTSQHTGYQTNGLRAKWATAIGGVALDRYTQPPLLRLIGGYLDQGLSLWRMPGADQLSFFEAVASLVQKSWLPLKPLNNPLAKKLLNQPVETAIYQCLHFLVTDEQYYERYLLEMLLAQPGWAGLVVECELHPESMLSPRRIRLIDYLAVSLILDVACLNNKLGDRFAPLQVENAAQVAPDAIPWMTESERIFQIWQEAFEWSYYESLLGGIVTAPLAKTRSLKPAAWALFCIDDRECSFRRHIEEMNPEIETFATAGFFGLDFMYKGLHDTVAGKHCPVLITPKHLVVEEAVEPAREKVQAPRWWRKIFPLEPESNTFFRGWILSHALGLSAALRLATSVFRPSLSRVEVEPLSTFSHSARLHLARTDDSITKEGLWIGYSIAELADRVRALFLSIGVEGKWPELVVLFGHGSSSVNNPYFAAYNCGACSGRAGAPNARAFAEAANMPQVREILRDSGIHIPDSTWFVGALHDTSKDEVTYFDVVSIPNRLQSAFEEFKKSIHLALERNALERCRRFAVVADDLTSEEALREVRTRAISLFEPRPEYNHATNAACIIGRRRLTEDIFLDRRAFLSSYDPVRDSNGQVLAHMLAAVIPVCAGINLEYFFSRIDPTKYGAGTKLSQNINGLIGVTNGIEGDLLTGLPTQMTEIHDPIRLILIVEQQPSVALAAAQSDIKTWEWISNEWIRYACIEPDSRTAWLYKNGAMIKIEDLEKPKFAWNNSLEAAAAGRENLPPGWLHQRGMQ